MLPREGVLQRRYVIRDFIYSVTVLMRDSLALHTVRIHTLKSFSKRPDPAGQGQQLGSNLPPGQDETGCQDGDRGPIDVS